MEIEKNKVIHLDKKMNYFAPKDEESDLKIEEIPNLSLELYNLVIAGKDYQLVVDGNKIKKNNIGQYYFDYKKTRYIIDDGRQMYLIRSGYIVLNDYDKDHLKTGKGIKYRDAMMNEIFNHTFIYDLYPDFYNGSISFIDYDDGYRYFINIDTIGRLVDKNNIRKDLKLPYYPFIKDMDNYGTFYVSIFCQDISTNKHHESSKYIYADKMVTSICNDIKDNIDGIDNVKFSPVIIKKRILYYDELGEGRI